MTPQSRVILFDLGNTLIYSLNPWDKVLFQGVTEFHRILCQSTPYLADTITPADFHIRLKEYYQQRTQDLFEKGSFSVLKEYLREKGFYSVSDSNIMTALNGMYSVTQLNWEIEKDTYSTLSRIQALGFRLGLLSNAANDNDVQQLIDTWKLRHYFDFIQTSADCNYRKPHPEMFRNALAHFSTSPQRTFMVGDTLSADIKGANDLGIFSIWINRRSKSKIPKSSIKPDLIINNLNSLIPYLENIQD